MGAPRIDPAHLRIRRAEPSDHAALARAIGTVGAYSNTLQLPMPSVEGWRERLAKVSSDGVLLVAEVCEPATPDRFEVIGDIGLQPSGTSPRRRHAMGIGMNIRDDWQGRGIGTALMHAAIDRADNWMNVLRIELTVFVDNVVALALYRRFGFVVEGTHRAYALRDGAYVDAFAMARLHPRPPMLPTAIKE